MESLQLQLRRYAKAAWQRRWLALAAAWIICVLGWIGVYMIPNQYESSARLYVDADAVLTPLLRGIAAESSAMTQLDTLQRTLLSRPNLQKLISRTDLDLTLSSPSDTDRLIGQLSNEIKIRPQTRSLFTIDYRNSDPKLAYNVVQQLLALFVENATGSNRSDMENARRFLDSQIAGYEVQLRAAERRRAEFRLRYLDILPQDSGDNGYGNSRLDQVRGQVVALTGQLEDATTRRNGLKQELANTAPTITSETEAGGGGGGGSRLAQAEDQLRELRLRYTDDYPDVIATKQLIASLRASPPASAAGSGKAAVRSRSISNPVYEQLKLRLVDAESTLSSLRRQLDESTKERDALDAMARQAPGVLAQYKALDRDYGVLRRNQEELLTRREATNIAQAADTQADKVKVEVIDPPQVPRHPVSPNRPLLIAAVLLVGIGAGIGISFLIGQLDRSFRTLEDLRDLGLPVLGGISVLGSVLSPRRVASTLGFYAGVLALMVVFGGLLAYVVRSQAMV